MGAFLSPRVDALSKLAPNLMTNADNVAKADGLTEEEAQELVAWLKDSGYQAIEVVHEAEKCSVLWKK